MTEQKQQALYYVVSCILKFRSLEEAQNRAGDMIATHVARSKHLHEQGILLMSGAFLDKNAEPLSTMGILTSREAAEAYVKGDPLYVNGMMSSWSIREWANMFAE
jgi:uncharacterized protein